MNISELQQERIQIFHDVMDNKIPRRVPINVNVSYETVAQFGEIDLMEAQWNPTLINKAANDLCDQLYSDVCPATVMNLRSAEYYEILQSQSFVMGSNGFIQHPEVVGMEFEDYNYLIEKPWDCLLERIIPRQFKSFDPSDPVSLAIKLAVAIMSFNSYVGQCIPLSVELTKKHGYYPGNGSFDGFSEAPFDYLADQLRSFSQIFKDVKRVPQKVIDACEALYPIVLKKGMPLKVNQYSRVTYPLHMPTFMRDTDFSKLWWPSFSKMCNEYASLGVSNSLWCEDNWMRYLDYLYELPTNTILIFEYGDPQKIKDQLGQKHIISGLYPITLLKTGTKQQCIDKAKELIDILSPGGKYIFGLDKVIITNDSINIENLNAVTEYVRDNAVYTNAGETAGLAFNKEDYTAAPRRQLESKYYTTIEELMSQRPCLPDYGAAKIQTINDSLFGTLSMLLI